MDYEPSKTFRGADGNLYARVVEESSVGPYEEPIRSPAYQGLPSRSEMPGRSDRPVQSAYRQGVRTSLDADFNGIIPSIESPHTAMLSPQRQQVSTRHAVGSARDRPRISFVDLPRDTLEDVEIIDMTNDAQQISKRRRYEAQYPDVRNHTFNGPEIRTTPSQPKEPVYISLISPPGGQPDPMQLDSRPPPYTRGYGQENVHTNTMHGESVPPLISSRRVDRPASGMQAVSTSDTGYLHSHPVTYVSERPLPRDGKTSSSHRGRSSVSSPTSPDDRGIQEYRAFRAKERQVQKAMQKSPAQHTYLMEVDQGFPPVALESRHGNQIQLDRSQQQQRVVERPTSTRLGQSCQIIDDPGSIKQRDDYHLMRGRDTHVLSRRRSASPSERAHHALPRSSLNSQAGYYQQNEEPRRYIQVDGAGNAHRFVERQEQVPVQPTRR